ncbi:MAG: AAA family ATPase [Bacteroidales bacterium]|jgi:predicted AAA+ superfamily ATPase|nr:AAA family ATPase [Bacteroidales bacterium]
MDVLIKNFTRILNATPDCHKRYLYHNIDWDSRLIGIVGARGTGKTTLMLQHIKANFPKKEHVLYASLDNIWFTNHSLVDLAEKFDAYGGTYLFLDEAHRYPAWAIEIKNIYDSFPDMRIVFTGSSMLKIFDSNADLSRRVVNYELKGLSFREFLLLEDVMDLPVLSLEDILQNHQTIASEIVGKIKILPEFKKYLRYGYYPIFKEGIKSYEMKLKNIVNTILENDLPAVESIDYSTIYKLKKLLMILSALVPYSPNINQLSNNIETNRASALKYLDILKKAALIQTFLYSQKGLGLMTKPDKIYLNNTNLLYALVEGNVNTGNIRETFFANQTSAKYSVTTSDKGDFKINGKVFETGGESKTFAQIKDIPDGYLAIDEIEVGYCNRIPLWLFGFLY